MPSLNRTQLICSEYQPINRNYRWWIMYSNSNNAGSCLRTFIGGIAQRLSSFTVIVITWILGLSITLPPLFGWSHYVPEDSGMRYLIAL